MLPPHAAIPQFEPSNMVSAALCVTTVVVCVVAQGEQAVACNPRTWGILAQCPMAALAAEEDVHTTVRHLRTTHERPNRCSERCARLRWGVSRVLEAHPSTQAVACTPQGLWALAMVSLASSTISSMCTRCDLRFGAFRARTANGELRCISRNLVERDMC